MRLKHAIALLPLPNVMLLVRILSAIAWVIDPQRVDAHVLNPLLQWDRVTASRMAVFYLIFSLLSCTLQIVFQAQALSTNTQAVDSLTRLISTGRNDTLQGFFVLDSQLHFCDHAPMSLSTKSCRVVWNGKIGGAHKDKYVSHQGNNITLGPTSLVPAVSPIVSPVPIPSSEALNRPAFSSSARTTTSSSLPSTPVRSPVTDKTASPSPTALVQIPPTTKFPSSDIDSDRDKRSFLPKPRTDMAENFVVASNGSTVVLHGFDGKNVTLEHDCLVALNWPLQT